MSIIQKLENSYVAILRVVVIVVATILLVVAVVMGAMSLKGMLPTSQQKVEISSVDPKDVLAEVATSKEKQAPPSDRQRTAEPEQVKTNPYAADYEKAYTAVASFVKVTSKNTLQIDKVPFFNILDQKVAEYDVDEVKAKYIAGLATAFGTSLSDKRLITRIEKPVINRSRPVAAPVSASAPDQTDGEQPANEQSAPALEPIVADKPYNESPFVVVDEVFTAYNKMFNQKLVEAKEKQGAADNEHMETKANAMTRMYIAGGVFGTFLLVIFLTIAIRIERNMREIAARP
jgi:hypothetical protein